MTHAGAGDPTPCPGVPPTFTVGTSWGDNNMTLKIKRARKSVPLVTDLALAAEHERAVEALQRAQREAKKDDRENSGTVKAAAARVVDLEKRMQSETIHVELEAMQRKKWAEFEEANPPRKDNDIDQTFRINVPALDEAIGASVVGATGPDGEPVEFDWAEVTDELSNGQWQEFALAVIQVNRGATDAPFSLAASAVTRSSGEN